jgi:hypothetical protein
MRKVDAGARTFFGSGFGMLAVWSSGPAYMGQWRINILAQGESY